MVFTSYIFGCSSNVRGSIGKFHGMVLELTSIRLPEVKGETILLIAHSAVELKCEAHQHGNYPTNHSGRFLNQCNYYHWHLKNCHSIFNSGQIR